MLDIRRPATSVELPIRTGEMPVAKNPGSSSGSRCNFVDNLSTSRVMCTAGFGAAILDLRLPVTFFGILNRSVEMPDPEKPGVAFGISLITCLQAELFSLQLVT